MNEIESVKCMCGYANNPETNVRCNYCGVDILKQKSKSLTDRNPDIDKWLASMDICEENYIIDVEGKSIILDYGWWVYVDRKVPAFMRKVYIKSTKDGKTEVMWIT